MNWHCDVFWRDTKQNKIWLTFKYCPTTCFAIRQSTRVLDCFFKRVPSTQPYEYENFPSTEGFEYEYSNNDTWVPSTSTPALYVTFISIVLCTQTCFVIIISRCVLDETASRIVYRELWLRAGVQISCSVVNFVNTEFFSDNFFLRVLYTAYCLGLFFPRTS